MKEVKTVPMRVGILLFDDVDVLDFAGPMEVFSLARGVDENGQWHHPFQICTLSANGGQVTVAKGLRVNVDYALEQAPLLHIIIVPGGPGAHRDGHETAIHWLARRKPETAIVAGICTGALLLGRAGLLDGRSATTHRASIGKLRAIAPHSRIVENVRYVDEQDLATSAGITAGMDLSVHLVRRLVGDETADRILLTMEYQVQAGS